MLGAEFKSNAGTECLGVSVEGDIAQQDAAAHPVGAPGEPDELPDEPLRTAAPETSPTVLPGDAAQQEVGDTVAANAVPSCNKTTVWPL